MYVQLSGTEACPPPEHHALMDVNVDWRRGVPRGREHGQQERGRKGVYMCVLGRGIHSSNPLPSSQNWSVEEALNRPMNK